MESPPAFWLAIVGMILMMIPIVVTAVVTIKLAANPAPPAPNPPNTVRNAPTRIIGHWVRSVARLSEVGTSDMNNLQALLATVHSTAQTKVTQLLHNRVPAPAPADVVNIRVRANVFVADTGSAMNGDVCRLVIPEELQIGMDRDADKIINLHSNEGVTGKAFASQMAHAGKCERAKGGARWKVNKLEGPAAEKEDTTLTERNLSLLGKDLFWVVSFPLKSSSTPNDTIAVLSVDGVGGDLEWAELDALHVHLRGHVSTFAAALDKLGKSRVEIRVESILPS